MDDQFADASVLVTGATGGIGRAIAERFASDGASVAVNSRDAERAEATAAEIEAAGGTAIGVGADVSEAAEVEAMVETVVDAFDGLDVLVNNAGINRRGPVVELDPADWRQVLEVDLTGPFLCARAAGPALHDGGGAVVNVSSMYASVGVENRAPYCASKAGLEGLTRALAVEWAPDVQVNAVAPGYVATEMAADAQAELGFTEQAIRNRTPMDRLAEPEEIATCVAFLAAADTYTTGEVHHPDGGWLAFGWGSRGE